MRYFLFILIFSIFSIGTNAQSKTEPQVIKPENFNKMRSYEDSLQILSDSMIFADDDAYRSNACFSFIKKLVRALKTPQSYLFTFDSLRTISIVNSPDNKFRILTWGLLRHNGTYRYYGAIQMNKPKLELFPLFDYSPIIRKPEDTVCNKDSWYGCMYYNIIANNVGSKTYYTLFGWKAYNPRTMKKVMDILYFDRNRKPAFGAPLIVVSKDKQTTIYKRYIIEYNKSTTASINFNKELNLVVFDHLVSKSEMGGKPVKADFKPKGYNMYPDGTYEAFEWKNNRWEYISALKNVENAVAPTPVPFFDNKKTKGYMRTKTAHIKKGEE